ncbi:MULTISPECIES: YcxB family protein [Variovorax]|uniref:YcxB family protein n=1 Tax=Variovorax TaxID=34072 RepID=UPI0028583964|nr:YcxB family protein [Variovorax sp. 3319]MDR6890924.1 hypothetical protein [Variovorax sp. 3319]
MKTATFKITEDDYIDAIRLHSKMPPALRWIGAVLAFILAAGAACGSQDMRALACITLASNLLAIFAVPVLFRFVSRRHYRNYRAIQAEFSAVLNDCGLHLGTEFGESRITWGNILKWRHNSQYLLLYMAPRLFHVVPKSIAIQGFDLQRLLEGLHTNVGPAS